jgi:hypothetical protein
VGQARQLQAVAEELRMQLQMYMEKFKSIEGTMTSSQTMLNDFKKEITKACLSLSLRLSLFAQWN